MAVLEKKKLANIEFFEAHYPVWGVAPATVGLTGPMVTDLANKTVACRDAYNAALGAREASKGATANFYGLYNEMMEAGREDIRQIKAFAEMQPNPLLVYAAAQIPAPLPPGPATPPGEPFDYRVGLNPGTGSLTLRWKAPAPTGGNGSTFWMVSRIIDSAGDPVFVGGCGGEKTFEDTDIPNGTASIKYLITGRRGGVMGTTGTVTVALGTGSGGGAVASVVDAKAVKMAA
jgi:hypothetical protein